MPLDEFRVFISSTFRDLQQERAVLLNRIFPELRHRCRQAGAEFTEIDLRWGLTKEDAEQGRVIRLCLEEVERCPYFIGVLGERYGWIPGREDVLKDPELLVKYPWIDAAVKNGWSVTEYEMYLATQLAHKTIRLYAKSRVGAEVRGLLDRLQLLGQSSTSYKDADDLGLLIRRDWLEIIEQHLPLESEIEERHHEAFARNRIRAYIPPTQTVEQLIDKVASGDSVVVYSASGCGKSSLSSYLFLNAGKLFPDHRVFAHFAGASTESITTRSLISRLCRASSTSPREESDIQIQFEEWAEQVDRPTLLILDAVDQLQFVEGELAWLPDVLPKNVQLLITCSDEHYRTKLHDRREYALELRELSVEGRTSMVRQYLQSYSKQLEPQLVEQIVSAPQTANPLFLRLLLEELRLFGQFEQLPERVEHYLKARTIADLIRTALQRVEDDFSYELVSRALGAIALTRHGLSEEELSLILDPVAKRDSLSSLVLALDYHLVQKEDRYGFFHQHILRAVERRYLHDRSDRQAVAEALDQLFLSYGAESRAIRERAHLYFGCQDHVRLLELLTDRSALEYLLSSDFEVETYHYWLHLERIGVAEMATSYSELSSGLSVDSDYERSSIAALGLHLVQFGRLETAKDFLRRAVDRVSNIDDPRYHDLLRAYSFALSKCGEFNAALDVMRTLARTSDSEPVFERAVTLSELSGVLFELGQYEEANVNASAAHALFVGEVGETDARSIDALVARADALRELGRTAEAELLQKDILRLRIKVFGRRSVQAATAMNNLATFLRRFTTRYTEAQTLLEEALSIVTEKLGELHPNRATALANLAALLREAGKLEESKPLYEESVEMEIRLHGPRHPKTATALHNFAHFHYSIGQFEEAERRFREVLELRCEILGRGHAQTIVTIIMLGVTLLKLERFEEAESLFLEALEGQRKITGDEHHVVGVVFTWLGKLKQMQQEWDTAAHYFSSALDSRMRSVGPADALTGDSQLSLSQVAEAKGETEEAIRYLELAIECFRVAYGPEHTKTKEAEGKLDELGAGIIGEGFICATVKPN